MAVKRSFLSQTGTPMELNDIKTDLRKVLEALESVEMQEVADIYDVLSNAISMHNDNKPDVSPKRQATILVALSYLAGCTAAKVAVMFDLQDKEPPLMAMKTLNDGLFVRGFDEHRKFIRERLKEGITDDGKERPH